MTRNDSWVCQRCLSCPRNSFHHCTSKPCHSMTRARINQLPNSEGQPECHPRWDAYFNFISPGPQPMLGADDSRGPAWADQGNELGWHGVGVGWGGEDPNPERKCRLGCQISIWNSGGKEEPAQLAFLEENHPTSKLGKFRGIFPWGQSSWQPGRTSAHFNSNDLY